MRSITALSRALAARAGAAALAVPMLFGGAPASAGFVSHIVTPAIANGAQFEPLAEDLGVVKFGCQKTTPPTCYGPDQIRSAYNIQSVLDAGFTGAGSTIVIIDAFQSPTLQTDLAAFDKLWNLKAPPGLNVIAPWSPTNTPTPFNPLDGSQVSWSAEISVDVEWAHAIAPDATIDLVLAQTAQDPDMLSVTQYAVDHNLGDVISQSFGEAESCADPKLIQQEHAIFGEAVDKGITLLAAAGDQGAAQPTCDGSSFSASASTPASDPNVTAIGGTRLTTSGTDGTYGSESAWTTRLGATGGGFSTIYRRPGFQAPFQDNNKQRGIPDVAINGDALNSGVIVVWGGKAMRFGGTSAGSPQWAGIVALADQMGGHRLGDINKSLYHIGKSDAYGTAFHDVTAGDNSCMAIACKGVAVQGFPATPGWDAATGLGTPDVANLIPLLI
ncbi:MAG TPA: S53 family peptidase [Candidatus Angelobacter sp.]|nr:S53 family peptidase [Candidatus Angelobacter sp.]